MEILNSCNSSKEKFDFIRKTFLKPEPVNMLNKIFAITIICDATFFIFYYMLILTYCDSQKSFFL